MARKSRSERLDAALDRLAGLYDGGHLLLSTVPENVITGVCEEVERLRAFVARFDAWEDGRTTDPRGFDGDLLQDVREARGLLYHDPFLEPRRGAVPGKE